MLTDAAIDTLQSMTTPGGLITDENRFDRLYLLNVLNTYREYVVQDLYRRERRVAHGIYQEFIIYKDLDYEDNCVGYFPIPNVIQIGSDKSGFNYVGSYDGTYKLNIVLDRGTSVSNKQNRILRSFAQNRNVLYNQTKSLLEVQNPDIEKMKVDVALFNPTQAPDFNYYQDNYPLDEGLFAQITEMLQRGFVRLIVGARPDRESNGAEDVTVNQNTGK
jgi:hypothetical protein